MLIYLTHPNHGTHIAYTQDEADKLVKESGWTIRKEAEIHAMARKPTGNPLAEITEEARPRRGRSPRGVTQ